VIVDNTHRPWMISTAVAAAVATMHYGVYLYTSQLPPRGGSWFGLACGIAGTFIIIFEGLLSWRKKVPAAPLGRVQTWLRGHIWLGLLSFVLILFHTGFEWGEGLAGVLMWLFVIISLSGIYGLVLQQFVPRAMTNQVKRETVYEEIPAVIQQLRREADERVEYITADLGYEDEPDEGVIRAVGEKVNQVLLGKAVTRRKSKPLVQIDDDAANLLRRSYREEIRTFLQTDPPPAAFKIFGSASLIREYFKRLETLLPAAAREVLTDLEQICDERRQLAVQRRLHHWLHAWLYLHVPISMAFLVLIFVHAIGSLWY